MRLLAFVLFAGFVCLPHSSAAIQPPAPPSDTERAKSPEWFEEKVRPLLVARCYECHTDDKSGGLRVDSREDLITGGESGSAIEPGKPEESLLIKMVQHVRGYPPMPKKAAKLKSEEIEILVEWVKAGAPWPKSATESAKPVDASPFARPIRGDPSRR